MLFTVQRKSTSRLNYGFSQTPWRSGASRRLFVDNPYDFLRDAASKSVSHTDTPACRDPSSTNTAASEQPSVFGDAARSRRTPYMHAVVNFPHWPHLGLFRSAQRCAHGPKLSARPFHGSKLVIVCRNAPSYRGTQWCAATWRIRRFRGLRTSILLLGRS